MTASVPNPRSGRTSRHRTATRLSDRLAALVVAATAGVLLLSGCVSPTPGGGRATGGPVAGPSAGSGGPVSASEAAVASALETLIASDPGLLAPQTVFARTFYERRAFRPAWTTPTGLNERGRQARGVLETAWADGVTGVRVPPGPSPSGRLDPPAQARHDAQLTAALADYVHTALPRRPAAAPRVPDGVLGALHAIATDDPDAARPGRLFRLVSEDDRQARLRRGMVQYQALAEAGGWPTVPATGPKLEVGSRHPDVRTIRARLRVTGDLADGGSPGTDADLLDPALVMAVKRYQARHGLTVDGKVGPRTRAAMSVPITARLQQMALNLHRLREIPADPAGRSIEVNIAGAALEGRENGRTTFRTDVIVGRGDRPTPRLRSAINRMVLNPTWTVPTTIARKDILPKLRNDPEYLARNNFQVFDGWGGDSTELDPTTIDWTAEDIDIQALRLRQRPGGSNALGNIKFLFPNDHAVYLHSTPSRGLFARSNRTFSSGCVRVRDPLDLAAFLLDDPATWTSQSLSARLADGRTRTVQPPRPVPLSMIYLTAWVDDDGTVQFRRDVYGHDAREMAALPKPRVTN